MANECWFMKDSFRFYISQKLSLGQFQTEIYLAHSQAWKSVFSSLYLFKAFFPTPYSQAHFQYLLQQFASHFFSIQLNLVELECKESELKFHFNVFEYNNLNLIQSNSIQVSCSILQYLSFEWNLMSTKSIHYSHQPISTGTATAVWSSSENFQILSIWKCFFPILLCKISLENAHGLLVSTKVDPKVVSLNPELIGLQQCFLCTMLLTLSN
jgi:hypothetical protein